MTSQSTLKGAAGEYYVMSQLLRRNMIAALAPAGVPNSDIIVTDEIGDKVYAIQVKTRTDKGPNGGWHMKQKHEEIASPLLFYCFLDFGGSLNEQPKCWVVPSKVVAKVLRQSHANWLSAPGKNGQVHKDGEMRHFLPCYAKRGMEKTHSKGWLDQYLEAWNLLKKA